MNNWWDLNVVIDQKYSKPTYHEETVNLTVTGFGELKEYQNGIYQKVNVLDQYNQVAELSWYYHKTGDDGRRLQPSDCNKPLAVQVKVENDNSQYSINGKKYTLRFPREKSNGNGNGNGNGNNGNGERKNNGNGYRKDTPEEVLGKCMTHLLCATLQGGMLPSTLEKSDPEVKACYNLAQRLVNISIKSA